MPSVIRDGVRLAYFTGGSGDRTLLFVHGWCCNHTYFAPQADYFAELGFRTVSVDLRGHGDSDKPPGEYPISQFAADVADVIDQLDLDRPVVVGHSMGGITALQLAASHPTRLRGIVLVDPAPLDMPEATKKALEETLAAVEAGDRSPFRSFVENVLFVPTDDPELKHRISREMAAAPPHVITGAGRAIVSFEGKPAAAACRVPVLHIAAEPPLNLQRDMTEWFDHIVNAQTSGAGHFNQLVVPNQVNDMIDYFTRKYVDWA